MTGVQTCALPILLELLSPLKEKVSLVEDDLTPPFFLGNNTQELNVKPIKPIISNKIHFFFIEKLLSKRVNCTNNYILPYLSICKKHLLSNLITKDKERHCGVIYTKLKTIFPFDCYTSDFSPSGPD